MLDNDKTQYTMQEITIVIGDLNAKQGMREREMMKESANSNKKLGMNTGKIERSLANIQLVNNTWIKNTQVVYEHRET